MPKLEDMNRVTRYIFTGFTMLSLLLLAASVVIWIRSYQHFEGIYVTKVSGSPERSQRLFWNVRSSLGSVGFYLCHDDCPLNWMDGYNRALLGKGWVSSLGQLPPGLLYKGGGWLGFHREVTWQSDQLQTAYGINLVMPYWVLLIVFMALPLLFIVRLSRQRRFVDSGLCLTCGYDLRATPERCPECGNIPLKALG
jgi:hypothetical protein